MKELCGLPTAGAGLWKLGVIRGSCFSSIRPSFDLGFAGRSVGQRSLTCPHLTSSTIEGASRDLAGMAPRLSAVRGSREGRFMKRFGTAFAVALVTLCVTAGCNDYGNTFQGNTGANLTSLSPSNVSAGGPDFVLTVIGSGFVNTCKSGTTSPSCATTVQWNGKNLVTTATVDANSGNVLSVTAVVPAALTATPGRASVNTLNPNTSNQNNGLSRTIAFIISVPANPVPTITGISPNIATPGSGDLVLNVSGSNYIQNTASNCSSPNGSVVQWTAGGTTTCLNPSATTASQLTATVPANLLAVQGCAIVTVFTPPAVDPNNPAANGGGGTSPHGQTFTVSSNANFCPAAAMQAAQGAAMVAEETPAVSVDGRFVAYTGQQGT